MFLSFQLNDECLNIIIMRSKALCSGWSQVSQLGRGKKEKLAFSSQKKTMKTTTFLSCLHVGSCHAAKVLLKNREDIPHSGGESLGVQHANGAATLEKGGS